MNRTCNAWDAVCEFARSLGATIDGVGNWDWANGFLTREDAEKFVAFLSENGYEHRGVYDVATGYSVKFR